MFLTAYDEYRTLEEFANRLEQSLRKLIERRIQALAAGESGAPIWLGDPFRGLESYEFEHAPIFFGRDAAVTKATEQLAGNARSGCAFLLVSGASGSGKSSLVKAGIVPRLMKPQRISGMAFLRRVVFRPGVAGSDVVLSLARALTTSDGESVGLSELIAPGLKAEQLAALLRTAASEPGYLFALALGRMTEAARQSGRILAFEQARLLLVVDQLEELFTSSEIGPEDLHLFIQLLAGIARSGAVWVIATLRDDFWPRAAELLIPLAEGQGRIDIKAASPAELAEMIRKPAEVGGLSFETHPGSGLRLDAVLAEHAAAAPGALPLLSFTLDELYRSAKARGEVVLTHANYEALGGLEGATARRADEVLANLPATAQATLPRVLRALTTITSVADQSPVARAAPLASFAEGSPARTLVNTFTAARLLVATSEGGAPPSVRLAHEALISRWRRARDQLVADRRDLQTRALVERQFERWSGARGRERSLLLLRNPDLANAIDLASRWGDKLDASVHAFISRSGRRARILQMLTAAAAVLFAIVAGGALLAEREAVRAQRDTELRQVNLLAELSTSERLRGNWDNALRLGAHASRVALDLGLSGAESSPARAALASTVWQSDLRLILRGHESSVLFGGFSSDGARIVTASADNTARIWDGSTGDELAVLRGHEDQILSAAFSPDGTRIVTGGKDTTARVWDAATTKQLAVLPEEHEVIAVAFTPDGKRILTLSGTALAAWNASIWDAASGQQIAVLRERPGSIDMAFSADGTRIVLDSGRAVRVLDLATRKELASMRRVLPVDILSTGPGRIIWPRARENRQK